MNMSEFVYTIIKDDIVYFTTDNEIGADAYRKDAKLTCRRADFVKI